MTPHSSTPEIELPTEVNAGKQDHRMHWPALRSGFKAHGARVLSWLKIGLKQVLIAAYIGLLANIALTFAGF